VPMQSRNVFPSMVWKTGICHRSVHTVKLKQCASEVELRQANPGTGEGPNPHSKPAIPIPGLWVANNMWAARTRHNDQIKALRSCSTGARLKVPPPKQNATAGLYARLRGYLQSPILTFGRSRAGWACPNGGVATIIGGHLKGKKTCRCRTGRSSQASCRKGACVREPSTASSRAMQLPSKAMPRQDRDRQNGEGVVVSHVPMLK